MSANPTQFIRPDEALEGDVVIRALKERDGQCFKFALLSLVSLQEEGRDANATLVHGVISGYHRDRIEPGHEIRIAHAWLEQDDWVFEATADIWIPSPDYYRMVDAAAERRYSYEQARAMCLLTSSIGPWHETAGVFT